MAALKNIVWVGTGKTGLPILEKVHATGQFNCKLLVRQKSPKGASLPLPPSSVHEVDFADHTSLVEHLRGQDVVVVFTRFAPNTNFDTKHIALVNAAIEAGVKYFIPSEWAMDTAGAMGSTTERAGPTLPTNMALAPKRSTHNYLFCRAAEKKICFAAIFTGVLIESSFKTGLLRFDFLTHTAALPDNGVNPFPACSFFTLSGALVALLANPSKISNRFYHVSDGVLTQQDVVRIAEAETKISWKVSSFSIEGIRRTVSENMQKGTYGNREFTATLTTAFFGGLQVFTRLDNEFLGVEMLDIRAEVARLVKERTALAKAMASRL